VLHFCCKELFLNLPEITPKMPESPSGRGVIFPIGPVGLKGLNNHGKGFWKSVGTQT